MSKSKTEQPLQSQLAALDAIVAWFTEGDFDLDLAATQYAEGVAIAQSIQQHLTKLENHITILKERFDAAEK